MTIIQHRLSTEPVPDTYLDPDGRDRSSLNTDWEDGPIYITDTSEGQQYQAWQLSFVGNTFVVTPETTGSAVNVLSGQDSVQCSFAFDQNGRVTLAWIDSVGIAWLYWYDSEETNFVTTNLGPLVSVMLSLDDKRLLQSGSSDIILWYTTNNAGEYTLWTREQRDRFTDPYEMKVGTLPYLYKAGMHKSLRGQIVLVGTVQGGDGPPPVIPPGVPVPQANLDFELGDVYWDKTGDFDITQVDPYAGSWSAIINTANYSTLENNVYTSLAYGALVSISCWVKGTIATDISVGFKFYNSSKSLIDTSTFLKSVTTGWTEITHSMYAPANAVYVRIFVESTVSGTVSLDNFEFVGSYFEVELDTVVFYTVELDATSFFEVEL